MRKLFIALLVFLAVVTFIRAYDNAVPAKLGTPPEISGNGSQIFNH